MPHPAKAVTGMADRTRTIGKVITIKPEKIYANSFVNNLEKSGFMK